jgi:hypothetical protein
MRAPASTADDPGGRDVMPAAAPRAFALGGFVAGAILAGIALSVHVLVARGAMVRWASGDWWAMVASVIPVGAATGVAGAGIGWWLASRLRSDAAGDRGP